MNQDHRIESVLKVLTKAEAPEGLEQRILRRLEAQPAKSPQGLRWLMPVCALGACAFVVLVIGVSLHRTSPVIPALVVAKNVTPQPAPLKNVPIAPQELVARHTPRPTRGQTIELSYPAPTAPLTEQEKLLVKFAQAREAAMSTSAETQVAAKPANKDVSLTGQEKLLVAVSRVRQDAVLDALDPQRRAAVDAADDKAFKDFVASLQHGGSL